MKPFHAILRRLRWSMANWARLRALDRQFRRDMQSGIRRPHGLAAPLVITLTSYPPRFPRLHHNLKSLLNQAVPADRVILWIAQDDMPRLPAPVLRLTRLGLEIRPVPDTRSFKKLVPALDALPDAFLVTADDDIVYRRDWLASLVAGVDRDDPAIVCRRAHRIKFEGEGFAPYLAWDLNVSDEASTRPSTDLLPVGIGGVLYPPRSLHRQVTDAATFMTLCPRGDDLWFWWMGRRLGTRVKRVPEGDLPEEIPGTQSGALAHDNMAGGNDRQLAALVGAFGLAEVKTDSGTGSAG